MAKCDCCGQSVIMPDDYVRLDVEVEQKRKVELDSLLDNIRDRLSKLTGDKVKVWGMGLSKDFRLSFVLQAETRILGKKADCMMLVFVAEAMEDPKGVVEDLARKAKESFERLAQKEKERTSS